MAENVGRPRPLTHLGYYDGMVKHTVCTLIMICIQFRHKSPQEEIMGWGWRGVKKTYHSDIVICFFKIHLEMIKQIMRSS